MAVAVVIKVAAMVLMLVLIVMTHKTTCKLMKGRRIMRRQMQLQRRWNSKITKKRQRSKNNSNYCYSVSVSAGNSVGDAGDGDGGGGGGGGGGGYLPRVSLVARGQCHVGLVATAHMLGAWYGVPLYWFAAPDIAAAAVLGGMAISGSVAQWTPKQAAKSA